MSEERKMHGPWFWISVALVAYVLSIGPAGRIAQETGADWIMRIYAPVTSAANAFPPLAWLVFVYWDLCGVNID